MVNPTDCMIQKLDIDDLFYLFQSLGVTQMQRLRQVSKFFKKIIDENPPESIFRDVNEQKTSIIRIEGIKFCSLEKKLLTNVMLKISSEFTSLIDELDKTCKTSFVYNSLILERIDQVFNQKFNVNEMIQYKRQEFFRTKVTTLQEKLIGEIDENRKELEKDLDLEGALKSIQSFKNDNPYILSSEEVKEVWQKVKKSEGCPYENTEENRQRLACAYVSSRVHVTKFSLSGKPLSFQKHPAYLFRHGMPSLQPLDKELFEKMQTHFLHCFGTLSIEMFCEQLKKATAESDFCLLLPEVSLNELLTREDQWANEVLQKLQNEELKIPEIVKTVDSITPDEQEMIIQQIQSSSGCPYKDNKENRNLLARIYGIRLLKEKGFSSHGDVRKQELGRSDDLLQIRGIVGEAKLHTYFNELSVNGMNISVDVLSELTVAELCQVICPRETDEKKIDQIKDEILDPLWELNIRLKFLQNLQERTPQSKIQRAIDEIQQKIQR